MSDTLIPRALYLGQSYQPKPNIPIGQGKKDLFLTKKKYPPSLSPKPKLLPARNLISILNERDREKEFFFLSLSFLISSLSAALACM